MSEEKVLVCVAWPYANGPLHLGHVAGSLLPPDVFARYQRMKGARVAMVSGSDMHGTPITVAAEKAGVPPEQFAAKFNESHRASLKALRIHFDLFTSTATANHREVVQDVFSTLLKEGAIVKKGMTAPYDPQARRFLPDRYVEGECPHCHFPDARGDQCDSCGRTLDPQELLKPRSKLSGAAPEYRETEHFFLRLPAFQERLAAWTAQSRDHWRPSVVNFTENWLKEGLKDRPITRDMAYGVPIPLAGYDDKRIYVWFEAVIGYLSATKEWAKLSGHPDAWKDFWLDSSAKSWYFLGKDNIPFHTIIWPAMIMGYSDGKRQKHNLPWDVPANEFMTFQGSKFSKSRGNLITVDEALSAFSDDALRYYLVANMPEQGDTNWAWDDFAAKINDELASNLGNYVNRVLAFSEKTWSGAPASRVPSGFAADDEALVAARLLDAAHALDATRFKEALRAVMAISRLGNQRFNDLAPWSLVKQGPEGNAKAAAGVLWHLGLIKTLAVALQPFLPTLSDAIWTQLGEHAPPPSAAATRGHPGRSEWPAAMLHVAPGRKLGALAPLVRRIEPADIATDAPQEKKPVTTPPSPTPSPSPSPFKPQITIDDFAKLDLRVAQVLSCEPHPKADKIWVLQVDLGSEKRQILAGLREHVKPEELVGRKIVVIANLQPRQIRGLESNGMVLAAEIDGVVAPLTPAKDVPPGASIK